MFGLFRRKTKQDGLTALSSDKLLNPYSNLIDSIYTLTGVPTEHWEKLYLKFIHNFAQHVQLLPASESHHHCGTGGLLTHSLEVGLNALKKRKGKMLPAGATSEIIDQQKELWSYAVFTAAVLHDIGKPLTDQIITIVSESPERTFTPLTETIPENSIYRIHFRRDRKYQSHENVALLLASKIIPTAGLNWIASVHEVLDDWTLCLTGRKHEANLLGEIITSADMTSTAQNLTGNDNIPLPSAKTKLLADRLMTSLTHLLNEDQIPINRAGAAGWVHDDKLWLVSKRILDLIRGSMTEEGQSGIPADNTRLMDELLQSNKLEPTEDGLAVWKMTVHVDSWKNNFTLLCFKLSKLWSDKSAWPASLENIQVVATNIKKEDYQVTSSNEIIVEKDSKAPTKAEAEKETVKVESNILDLPIPPGIVVQVKKNKNVKKEKIADTDNDINSKIEVVDNTTEKQEPKVNTGEKFVEWLTNGIADGSMSINVQNAVVHTVDLDDKKHLILVSPAVFRNFSKNYQFDYKKVQRDFQSLNLHKITENDKNVWQFKTLSTRKNKNSNILNAFLIEDPEDKLGIRLPPGNIHISASD